MKRPFNQVYPDQAVAICTREQAGQLLEFDHYVVRVNDRDGVLLTSAWLPLEQHTGPFLLTVVFHAVEKHPHAPAEIQSLVDGLSFQIRGQPR